MASGHQDESGREAVLEQLALLHRRLDHHDRLLEGLAATAGSLIDQGPVLAGRLALVEDGVEDLSAELSTEAARLHEELLAVVDRPAGTVTPEDVLRQVDLLRVGVGEALHGLHSWLVEQESVRHDQATRFEGLVEDLLSGVESRVLTTLEHRLAGVEDASAAVLMEARQAMAALIELVDVNARGTAAATSARVERLADDVVGSVEHVLRTASTRDSAALDEAVARVERLADDLVAGLESRVLTTLEHRSSEVEHAGAAVLAEVRQALSVVPGIADESSRAAAAAAAARVERLAEDVVRSLEQAARAASTRDSAEIDRAGARLSAAVDGLAATSNGLQAAERDRRRTEGELLDLLRTLLAAAPDTVATRPRLVDRLLGRSVEQGEPPRPVGTAATAEGEPSSPDLPALPPATARTSRSPEPAAGRLRPAAPRARTRPEPAPRAAAARRPASAVGGSAASDGSPAEAAGDGGTAASAGTAAARKAPARRASAPKDPAGKPPAPARKAPARSAAARGEPVPARKTGKTGKTGDRPAATAPARKAPAKAPARPPMDVADQPEQSTPAPDDRVRTTTPTSGRRLQR